MCPSSCAKVRLPQRWQVRPKAPPSWATPPNGLVLILEDQMREVGPGQIAHRVHLVHVAVRRIREAVYIAEVPRLGVLHLRSRHQRQAVVHATRLVGLVGLGDHQIDHRLDLGGPAGLLASGRRVDDGYVDGDLGSTSHSRPSNAIVSSQSPQAGGAQVWVAKMPNSSRLAA